VTQSEKYQQKRSNRLTPQSKLSINKSEFEKTLYENQFEKPLLPKKAFK